MVDQQPFSGGFNLRQHMGVALEIGDMQLHITGLTGAQHFTGTAQLKIFFGYLKTVGGFPHNFESCTAITRDRWAVEEYAMAIL